MLMLVLVLGLRSWLGTIYATLVIHVTGWMGDRQEESHF